MGLARTLPRELNLAHREAIDAAVAEARKAGRGMWAPLAGLEIEVDNSGEAATLRNTSDAVGDLSDWWLVSVRGAQAFSFPPGQTLAPGEELRVAAGEAPEDLRFGDRNVWNNSRQDPAELAPSGRARGRHVGGSRPPVGDLWSAGARRPAGAATGSPQPAALQRCGVRVLLGDRSRPTSDRAGRERGERHGDERAGDQARVSALQATVEVGTERSVRIGALQPDQPTDHAAVDGEQHNDGDEGDERGKPEHRCHDLGVIAFGSVRV